MYDEVGTTEYSYDQRGRITSQSVTTGGPTYTVSKAYDAMDRVTSITYPNSMTVYYQFNLIA